MADHEVLDEREIKRRKQLRKMTKIVAKAWNIPKAEPFQDSSHSSSGDGSPLDLTTIGQGLDAGNYQHGRTGWEKFAKDMGGVYNRHIFSNNKHASAAKSHMEEVKKMLVKIDPQLAVIASKASPQKASPLEQENHCSPTGKKRKAGQNGRDRSLDMTVPKKKHAGDNHSSTVRETLTLSQREHKAMDELAAYLEKCGGARSQTNNFRCKASQRSTDRFDVVFYSTEGRRFRSMIEIARFLGLEPDNKSHSSSAHSSRKIQTRKPRNSRECEAEKRRLRKELDKLMKAHRRATKALDDFRTDNRSDRNPIDDDLLIAEEKLKNPERELARRARPIVHAPDICGFPGIPAHCTPDLLMVWDFLCTFGRALSLEPISLDDFAAALTYTPNPDHTDFSVYDFQPVYLAEAHLAILRLLLQDPSSDEWWWSTLETDETVTDDAENGTGVSETDASGKKGKQGDQLGPIIKVDMAALLAVEEDPKITARWLQALEDVRVRKTNSGGPIKSAVKSAIAVTTNDLVKSYLKKAMRRWKTNAAGFTKRAVVWLVDRVREARPDVWGRKVSEEALNQQKIKVAHDAALVMDQVDEEADVENMNDSNLDGDSEESGTDESGDEEDDENFDEDAATGSNNASVTIAKVSKETDDDSTPVTTRVPVKPPPSLVDLLLPPAKPLPSMDLVTPFTWPCLAGATSCRILHRYKKKRNEVDDSLRELRELPALSVAERRKREAAAPWRILSECVSCCLPEREGHNPAETAIEHLCCGRNYLELDPVQKLCIFRLLIEACYDTFRVYQCLEDNFKSRFNAEKALDSEERRAKREAREEAAAAEVAARERLALEARSAFLFKKRSEIIRHNEKTNEFSGEFIEGLTDDDIAEFDDETKAEYDALPGPESFNKTEVNTMVARIQEEAAFDTHALRVLTMEEIEAREKKELTRMEERLASFGDVESVYQHHTADRETSAKIDKLQREIAYLKQNAFSLPRTRAAAVEALKDAIEDGTIKALRGAIKTAKMAKLTGLDDETNGVWALDLLRDAALELRNAERRKRVIDAQKDLVAKRNKCFIRTVPFGKDRYHNRFWKFDCDSDERVWVEAEYLLKESSEGDGDSSSDTNCTLDAACLMIGAEDKEEDILNQELLNSVEEKEKFVKFSRKEYFSTGALATLVKRHWGCHATDKSLRLLVKHLDGRAVREGELKATLKEILEAVGLQAAAEENAKHEGAEHESTSAVGNEMGETKASQPGMHVGKSSRVSDVEYQLSADEDVFRKAKDDLKTSEETDLVDGIKLLENLSSAIGKRIRFRRVPDPVTAPMVAQYDMGTVTGWKMQREEKEQGAGEATDSSENISTEPEPVWRVALDKGGEVNLAGPELIEGLCRALKWSGEHKGYVEDDAPFFAYRNNLGRFCGRAVDAPASSSPSFLARHMIKREQEFYTALKNRCYENNWGGKSGERNAWIASMREYGHIFETVRDGLLTLESAFFELSGGFSYSASTEEGISTLDNLPEQINGRDLLEDEAYRFDIELESIGGNVRGLWNSRETRAIFREIMQSTTTVGFLALGLDLLCRNCTAYLNLTRATSTRRSVSVVAEQPVGTRRLNAWQKAHQDSYF